MADEVLYTFDDAGMQALARDHRRLLHLVQNLEARLRRVPHGSTTAGSYVAMTPAAGLPAVDATGLEPGSAICEIYRRNGEDLVPMGAPVTVYNFRASFPGNKLIPVDRDAWGDYWAISDDGLVYLMATGVGGIPGRSGTNPGEANTTIYKVNPATGLLATTGVVVESKNASVAAAPASSYLPAVRDPWGVFWAIHNSGGSAFIIFGLNSDLDKSDASKSATVKKVWGETAVAIDATVDVYNHPSADGAAYHFKAPSGAWGTAVWDTVDGKWRILHIEDPAGQMAFCQFTLNSDLLTSDSSKSGTVEHVWGDTAVAVDDTIDVYNHETHTGGAYIFEGNGGDWGTAVWDGVASKWRIIQMECP